MEPVKLHREHSNSVIEMSCEAPDWHRDGIWVAVVVITVRGVTTTLSWTKEAEAVSVSCHGHTPLSAFAQAQVCFWEVLAESGHQAERICVAISCFLLQARTGCEVLSTESQFTTGVI